MDILYDIIISIILFVSSLGLLISKKHLKNKIKLPYRWAGIIYMVIGIIGTIVYVFIYKNTGFGILYILKGLIFVFMGYVIWK